MVAPTPSALPPPAPPPQAAAEGGAPMSTDARTDAGRQPAQGGPGGERPAPDAALVQQFQALVQAPPARGGNAEGSGPALPPGGEPLTRWPLPGLGLATERPLASEGAPQFGPDAPATPEPRTLSWPPLARREAPADDGAGSAPKNLDAAVPQPGEAEARAQAHRRHAADAGADMPALRDEPLPSPMALFQAPPADAPQPVQRAEATAAPQPTAADLATLL
ncbi:MAG: hypothetical protein JNM08_13015, partial [Rubrivivax sp.]|nr:hypothetical protein [Rubrivivax sp.]